MKLDCDHAQDCGQSAVIFEKIEACRRDFHAKAGEIAVQALFQSGVQKAMFLEVKGVTNFFVITVLGRLRAQKSSFSTWIGGGSVLEDCQLQFPVEFHLFPHRQIGLHLGGEGEHVDQHHLGEMLQFGCLLNRRLINFVKGFVSLKPDFMGPSLQVFRDQARCGQFINASSKIPSVNLVAVLLGRDINCSSEHGHCSGYSFVFKAVRSLYERLGSCVWNAFRADGCCLLRIRTVIRYRRAFTTINCSRKIFRYSAVGTTCHGNRPATHRTLSEKIKAELIQLVRKNYWKCGVSRAAVRTVLNEDRHGQ